MSKGRLNLYSLRNELEDKINCLEERIEQLEKGIEKEEKKMPKTKGNRENEVWDPSVSKRPSGLKKSKGNPVQKRPEGVKFHNGEKG